MIQDLVMNCLVYHISKRQILDSSKLKEFDDNFEFVKNGKKFSKRIENTVGKGEIALYKQFIRFLISFPKQSLVFTCLKNSSYKNTTGKGEIARYEQILLFPQYFLLYLRTFCHFYQT